MSSYLAVYRDLFAYGQTCSPRGEKVTELENYQFTLQPYERLTSFKSRNLNLNYCKKEFLWYLGANRFDTSIEQHATAWKKIRDEIDGGYNSNYGQYIFRGLLRGTDHGNQLDWVVQELTRDPDSRRACMVLLNRYHLRQHNPDVICTYGLSFRIRNGQLNMSVSMRSNDAIFGMTNDTFCFSMIHEMVLENLKEQSVFLDPILYPFADLQLGTYTHKVDSLHVYERHFKMLEDLVAQGLDGFYPVEIPRGTWEDFNALQHAASITPDKFETPDQCFAPGGLVAWMLS